MSPIDIIIIIGLLTGGSFGAKNGVFKQLVVLIGTIICFILAWYLKDIIANFLSYNLPFFGFGGLTSLNIVLYQLVAFLALMALFLSILTVLIRITGVFEKILKFTIVLGIPSKILGFIVGVFEALIIAFVILFFLKQPMFKFDITNESKIAPIILDSSPVLSNISGNMNKAITDVFKITQSYGKNDDPNKFNRKVVYTLLEHDVIDTDYLNKLREKGKINY